MAIQVWATGQQHDMLCNGISHNDCVCYDDGQSRMIPEYRDDDSQAYFFCDPCIARMEGPGQIKIMKPAG